MPPGTREDIEFRAASTVAELEQILALQRRNVEESLTSEEVRSEGFVSVRHDLNLLRDMNDSGPHVIAVAGGRVVGYALVMLRSFEARIEFLQPMFVRLRGLALDGLPVDSYRFFVMGQVCVDKPYRGRGVFAGLYGKMRELYAADFDFVITEVARRNTRSIRAHEKVGFEVMHRYCDDTPEEWDVVFWDWR